MRKGESTRERVMDVAEAAILSKGFAATSIEEIIAEVEITKSGFFYHFKDKNELAVALLHRYLERDDILLDDIFSRAAELHDDPLHAFLIGLKMFSEVMADIPGGHPGCMVAACCYNETMFNAEVRKLAVEAIMGWRKRFRDILDEIAAIYPPKDDIDLDMVADMISNMIEGGIIMSKAMEESKILAEQILVARSYVKLLFLPTVN